MLAELARQRTEGERLAAEAAQCVAAGKAAVEQAKRLAGTEERVLAWPTEMSVKGEVTSVERRTQRRTGAERRCQGHEVNHDDAPRRRFTSPATSAASRLWKARR